MMRKLMIILAVTFVPDQHLRIYLCMWIIMFFLALQLTFQPFCMQIANHLEIASLLVIAAVLNLSLLKFNSYWDPGLLGFHGSGMGPGI